MKTVITFLGKNNDEESIEIVDFTFTEFLNYRKQSVLRSFRKDKFPYLKSVEYLDLDKAEEKYPEMRIIIKDWKRKNRSTRDFIEWNEICDMLKNKSVVPKSFDVCWKETCTLNEIYEACIKNECYYTLSKEQKTNLLETPSLSIENGEFEFYHLKDLSDKMRNGLKKYEKVTIIIRLCKKSSNFVSSYRRTAGTQKKQ